jgi:hypothetical protein
LPSESRERIWARHDKGHPISGALRDTVLSHLLELNHDRDAEEERLLDLAPERSRPHATRQRRSTLAADQPLLLKD